MSVIRDTGHKECQHADDGRKIKGTFVCYKICKILEVKYKITNI